MKDPERLLDFGATHDELALLRAGIAEEPSHEGKQRLAAALGLGVSVWGTAAAASSKAATSPTVKTLASKWGVKWLAALGGVAIGGAALVAVMNRPQPVTDLKPSTTPAVTEKATEVAPAKPEHEVEALAVENLATEAPGATDEHPKATGAARQPGEVSDSASIAREIEAIDEVRLQVSRGQTGPALAALGKYRKEFPRGVLRQEATLLQIEALSKGGNLAAAREIGQRFLREHPRTPHEKRVRALLGDAP